MHILSSLTSLLDSEHGQLIFVNLNHSLKYGRTLQINTIIQLSWGEGGRILVHGITTSLTYM